MSSSPLPSERSHRARGPRTRALSALPAVLLLVLGGCGGIADTGDTNSVSAAQSRAGQHGHGHGPGNGNGHGHGNQVNKGKVLFETAFPDTNGRSCASCHVLDDHTTLQPSHVEALLASDPGDPLFNAIDADDPTADELSFDHLKKGLVRVKLKLPDNMDLIDVAGNVVTPPDRMYEVWRAVPTVENSAITAPYQYDGRRATLQEQAQGAITDHSQGGAVAAEDLDAIAEFQKAQFTSSRARRVAKKLEHGVPVEEIERPELHMDDLTDEQARGLDVYNAACEPCHGGATTLQVVDRVIHDLAFVELKPDGNVVFDTSVQPPVPVLSPQPDNEFLNIGLGNISYLGQLFGDLFGPRFNKDVALPQYRYRFYTDATRTVQEVDLPPIPVLADPLNPFLPAVDEDGAPIVGPNFLPQWFSTDPGRAGITGNPHDFEAFDVPPLRGIANTGPYFHDNSAETLRDAVDIYSRFILSFFGPLNLPAVNPPEDGSFFPESLTVQQKDDLMAFLQIL